ncbi:MAG: protein kinase [Kofleriaceae bacterium]
MQLHKPRTFGRYELLAELGRGGMAELFLGRLVGIAGFSKLVAIKRILPHLSSDPRFVEMFLNEGRIAARLSHPNVCQVYELGEVDGELFLAMEYLEGAALGELMTTIPRDPTIMVRVAASVIGQACDGLVYAHELRDAHGVATPVVHRDISPHNLFVTTDGICKLLDFGVSKVVTDADQTQSGLIKGKLPYMPPEQIRGEPIDARVDVFSAGVVLWETLTGERLFLRQSDFLIWKAIMEEPVPKVSSYHPVYGDELDAIIGKALAREREQRTPSIRAFAEQLREAASRFGGPVSTAELAELVRKNCASKLADRSRQIAALGFVKPVERVPAVFPAAEPSITRSVAVRDNSVSIDRRPRRRRWPLVALGVLAVGIVGFVAMSMIDDESDSVAAAPARIVTDAPESASVVDAGLDVGSIAMADAGEADSAEVAEEPEISFEPDDVATDQRHRSKSRGTKPATKPATKPDKFGYFSVDSNPYATIYIDGKRVDQTPLYHLQVSAGRRQIRAVLQDGRQRTFTVRIEPDKHVSSGTLSW